MIPSLSAVSIDSYHHQPVKLPLRLSLHLNSFAVKPISFLSLIQKLSIKCAAEDYLMKHFKYVFGTRKEFHRNIARDIKRRGVFKQQVA